MTNPFSRKGIILVGLDSVADRSRGIARQRAAHSALTVTLVALGGSDAAVFGGLV